MSDEKTIRDTIHKWLAATKAGDSETLAGMLDDDVLFVVQGRPPFGKREFFARDTAAPYRFESKVVIREVVVHDDWALTRVELELEMTPTKGSSTIKLAGPTMSVWRRKSSGQWVIWRDANMVAPAAE